MLKDLRKYNNLGSPLYFYELLNLVKNQELKENDILDFFYNRSIEGRTIFDGCIHLAFTIKLLYLDDGKNICLSEAIKHSLNSIRQMSDKFNEILLLALKEDEDLLNIFSSKHLAYDVIYNSIQIRNNAFGFKFSNFKQLLIDFEIIYSHPTPEIKNYIINSRYKKLFDKSILPEIKKRKIGIEELNISIRQQQINGEEAEMFVVAFETKRLNNTKDVNWVAEYVANEGFDIISYNSEEDEQHNRFIEVKSYQGEIPYFFWSRNEFSVAKQKKELYWLYLVNRDKINNANYIPQMIQNPSKNILDNDTWIKEVDKYKIYKLPKNYN
ncbi:DUF3883 domain-containing protein [Chryseobacterium fluminis]|uniref:DUF3883 domain-containing protein n=1 Tax=Chryseobacterium fluminis TaxID=2983606 RepID=UPI00224F975A|nr:DUF3883 domain-containing protein [Chryseobacterium sp. MMS21-Ot14]UZT97072.1 DUF3883 domain-containing protein [Chryseobacterium sp. MMS21-Ot14]